MRTSERAVKIAKRLLGNFFSRHAVTLSVRPTSTAANSFIKKVTGEIDHAAIL
jgi:hypothetical protein